MQAQRNILLPATLTRFILVILGVNPAHLDYSVLPAIQIRAKTKLPTWQFDLYNISDGSPSEIQRTRLSKLQNSLWTSLYTDVTV